ncbi:LLM class flavin-dependent oxidoreductase [Actinophytocola sp.]|uniref:LLM class flavin-dependent oxidoreductase n=1 Tax=Actinophytocola sp. TaxID=1872138 RepID=UPI002ED021CC
MTKLGLSIGPDLPPSRIGEVAAWIEESGVDELWLAEDCFFAGGIAAAATALAATERITVGLGILPAVARNAAFTAMEIAALASIYPGRVIVGLGHGMAGWMRQIGAAPKSPLTALGEHLQVVRDLLAGHTVTLDGDYVRLDRVRLDHPPVVVPPVLAGVRGPKSLGMAGKRADGVILAWPAAPAYVAHARALVEEAGPSGRPLVVACSPVSVDADPARARARLRPQVAAELSMPSSHAHLEPLGLVDDVTRLLAKCGSPDEFAARLPEEWIDELAIVGDPARCAAKISQLRQAGADSVVLALPPQEQRPGLRELISLIRDGAPARAASISPRR